VSEIDWEHRELCPDGACNGIVGPDGVCKVCGKAVPNWGDERMRGLQNEPDDDPADEADDDADDYEDDGEDGEDEGDDADETDSAEWSDRKLCDDGACVGVIGADGKCTVCGKRSAA
jgi:hypothetical protein